MEAVKKGSFTVEAAFIIPVVLAVLFGILNTGFMLYDEAVLEAAVLRFLEKGEMAVRHLGDMESGRPDYEKILIKPDEMEKIKIQEEVLTEEILGQLLRKREVRLEFCISGVFWEEKEIGLLGEAGKRSLPLFYPAEHKRRVSG